MNIANSELVTIKQRVVASQLVFLTTSALTSMVERVDHRHFGAFSASLPSEPPSSAKILDRFYQQSARPSFCIL